MLEWGLVMDFSDDIPCAVKMASEAIDCPKQLEVAEIDP